MDHEEDERPQGAIAVMDEVASLMRKMPDEAEPDDDKRG
jgi:hypothetical protein